MRGPRQPPGDASLGRIVAVCVCTLLSSLLWAAPAAHAAPDLLPDLVAELTRLVQTLEERHDTYMEGNPLPSPLIGSDGQVPSADALAAELEKFLSRRGDDDAAPG